ncbi:phage tail sheath family protein [Heliorestis acidaminivorans]|uniref:Phage tail sheath family protein n=1 Tax=Heliorestis acidaminivorans TaxID=553427 RepID=A0A6I0EPR6_9FIRM|nr:phage tail sheath subtilisin-like domain-containing protein [Heliorestis acidaminivorans]KAB2951957.1 phage tail sheath family protein [Heliorestis acidaminivorans]
MAEYLSPGVYVEEFDSASVPMEGVSTSTTGFVGLAERGPVGGLPTLITNYSEFTRKFGGFLSESQFGEYRYLGYAVHQYFVNGGARCYISRVVPENAKIATFSQEERLNFNVQAKNPGAWGNKINITFVPASKAKTQVLEVTTVEGAGKKYKVKNSAGFQVGDVVAFTDGQQKEYNVVKAVEEGLLQFEEDFDVDVIDTQLLPTKVLVTCELNVEVKCLDVIEAFDNVSFNVNASNFISNVMSKSELVEVTASTEPSNIHPYQLLSGEDSGKYRIMLSGGSDGTMDQVDSAVFVGFDKGLGQRTGLQSFVDNTEVSIMAIPGITDPNVQLSLVAHCENLGSRFAILDCPREKKTVTDIMTHKDIIDSQYAALYHPWIITYDALAKKNSAMPPSGAVAGIFARTDQARGVHKAPANETVRGCVGLDCQYNAGEQGILNPKGVNLIRSFQGQGIRVWGARTCSSNKLWKYINVRRLFIFLEESIKANTNWVVFEPNQQILWARVKRTIDNFLTNVWRNGALAGATPEEAFFVDIGHNTMTQDDIDNGRLICVIGVAAVTPAEFVIFRITQKTNEQ